MRMRDTEDGYDYISTHLDDFKVVAKNPTMLIYRITSVFLVKEKGHHKYYLGNDYTYHDGQAIVTYGSQTYTADTVLHVGRLY